MYTLQQLLLHRIFYLIVIFFIPYKAIGQDLSMDSLTSEINRLFALNNYEQAKYLRMQSLQIAHDSSDIRRALADLGYAYHKLDEFEQNLTNNLGGSKIEIFTKEMGSSLNDVFIMELKAMLSTTYEGGLRRFLSFPVKPIPKHTIT